MKNLARLLFVVACLAASLCRNVSAAEVKPAERERNSAKGFNAANIERPLRYTPVGTDFVITNGFEFFNRPLYGGSSPFRVDAGDRPEFSLYLPGRGGNLRLGVRLGDQAMWLHEAEQVVASYRPGMMLYEIHDPLFGAGILRLEVFAAHKEEGMLVRAEYSGTKNLELLFAFGGVNGWRGGRDGDIGCEAEPVAKLFQLRPENCRSNKVVLAKSSFAIHGPPGLIGGVVPGGTTLAVADAAKWTNAGELFRSSGKAVELPVVTGACKLMSNRPVFIGLQRLKAGGSAEEVLGIYRKVAEKSGFSANGKTARQWQARDLPRLFNEEETHRQAVAGRLEVDTPDPYVNAAVAALNVAEEAVWDDRVDAYVHGGVAWRMRLLGWRVAYAGDVLGAHERTAQHFEGFARQQNTNAIPAEIPPPEESANLARNETALHSNGDLTKSHYDMNMVGVDVFFRHLLWTGDREYARRLWPVIERHMAWERRLFRREFGPDKLPLYEAYACIWASDDLAYNGGGGTHSSAYNLYHNRMASRVARWLGEDSSVYDREADLLARGMQEYLWLPDRGWFAEWKDLLGLQLVHPNAAAWTFYHTVDSEVPTPLEAWQMTRFVDTQNPRFPIRGPGVPTGSHTISTTSWMPYTWSLNNVVLGETMHTALGYWQANRPEGAFPLFKGAILDSMYLGLCPGNVGMCTWFDATRRESQRDFADGVGIMSRTVVEGLFGVKPDLLAGEVTLRPGFPAEWDHASIRHPELRFSFQRDGLQEMYRVESKFARPIRVRLEAVALRDRVTAVTVNGHPAPWRAVEDAVGQPRIEIMSGEAKAHTIQIIWSGEAPDQSVDAGRVKRGDVVTLPTKRANVLALADPQKALSSSQVAGKQWSGQAAGTVGQRTVFAQVKQGDLKWWLPGTFEIADEAMKSAPVNWESPVKATLESVDLAAVFNDSVTQIFKNEYRTPRSPLCSLATPKQGIGSWCHPKDTFEVDDSGLRAIAARSGGKITLPNGVTLATPGSPGARNIAFVSQWDNYPAELTVSLVGKSPHAFLLMAGSTDAMKSRFDNGEVIVTYADGSTARLALHNPTTWWPIDQDYYIDEFAFARPEPLPPRIDLATGKIRVLKLDQFKGRGRAVPGGAATVLDLPLDATKELKSLTVRAIANEVVIGLMSVTLER